MSLGTPSTPGIAVIADDLTGAAELAAAAADLGLSAEVHTSPDPGRADFTGCAADVVAVDTDTRSRAAGDAARAVAHAAGALLRAGRRWIYKKTDSVLRGNVRAEVAALLAATGKGRSVLIPANPSKGRIVRGGVYYIGETPLADSAFANDPEHPRRCSGVVELLGGVGTGPGEAALGVGVAWLPRDEPLPPPGGTWGVFLPDADCGEDLARRAAGLDDQTLAAGGVEFFQAILQSKITAPRAARHVRSRPEADGGWDGGPDGGPLPGGVGVNAAGGVLFVCGSAAAWRQGRAAECERHGVPVLPMPQALFASAGSGSYRRRPGEERSDAPAVAIALWASRTASAVAGAGSAMAAIGRGRTAAAAPGVLTDLLVEAVSEVLRRVPIARVCIEGGTTAAALLRRAAWTRLVALPANPAGVATLRPVPPAREVLDALGGACGACGACGPDGAPTLLVKPGSYPWPEGVWPRPTRP